MTMVMVTVMTAREDKGDDDIYGHGHGHEYYGNGGADGDMMMMVLTRCGGGSDGGGGDGDAGVAMGCQIHMYSCHYALIVILSFARTVPAPQRQAYTIVGFTKRRITVFIPPIHLGDSSTT